MANPFVTFFESIGAWFAKVFKNVPAWNVVALSTLNLVAPLVETIVTLADPAVGAVITPIITAIQADLGTVSGLLTNTNTTNLSTLLSAIQSQSATLLSEAHITDPASVTKAQAALTTITSELQAILAAIPAA